MRLDIPYVFARRETRTVAHERSVTAKLRECAERRARLERVSAAIAEILEAEVALHAVLACQRAGYLIRSGAAKLIHRSPSRAAG